MITFFHEPKVLVLSDDTSTLLSSDHAIVDTSHPMLEVKPFFF